MALHSQVPSLYGLSKNVAQTGKVFRSKVQFLGWKNEDGTFSEIKETIVVVAK